MCKAATIRIIEKNLNGGESFPPKTSFQPLLAGLPPKTRRQNDFAVVGRIDNYINNGMNDETVVSKERKSRNGRKVQQLHDGWSSTCFSGNNHKKGKNIFESLLHHYPSSLMKILYHNSKKENRTNTQDKKMSLSSLKGATPVASSSFTAPFSSIHREIDNGTSTSSQINTDNDMNVPPKVITFVNATYPVFSERRTLLRSVSSMSSSSSEDEEDDLSSSFFFFADIDIEDEDTDDPTEDEEAGEEGKGSYCSYVRYEDSSFSELCCGPSPVVYVEVPNNFDFTEALRTTKATSGAVVDIDKRILGNEKTGQGYVGPPSRSILYLNCSWDDLTIESDPMDGNHELFLRPPEQSIQQEGRRRYGGTAKWHMVAQPSSSTLTSRSPKVPNTIGSKAA